MYSFSITDQLIVFIESVGFGVLLALGYSATYFFVSIFLTGKKKTYVSDGVFCVVVAVSLFSFILAYNLGKIRFYMVIGILIGFVAYFTAVGSNIKKTSDKLTQYIHKIFAIPYSGLKKVFSAVKRKLVKKKSETKKTKKKLKKFSKAIAKENEIVV